MSNKTLLNFADENDFSKALNYFGGEDYLKENFPHILQMVYDTKELHGQEDEYSLECESENTAEEINAGYEDSYTLTELPQMKTEAAASADRKCTSIYTRSAMSLVNSRQFLHMSSEISDVKTGKIFHAYAVHDKNKSFMEYVHPVSGSLLNYSKNVDLQVKSEFMTVKNVNGKNICETNVVNRTMDINIQDMTSDVKNVQVLSPQPKNAKDSFIKIVYKDRTDKNAAYTFKKATKNGKAVTVYFPFSIRVELDDDYEFDKNPIAYDKNFNISLCSNVVKDDNGGGGGEVHFNEAYKKSKIHVTAQGNILTIDFPYNSDDNTTYWGTDMTLTGDQASGYFDFHFNVHIYYHLKYNPNESLHTGIVVTSKDLPNIETSPNMKKILQSSILWGCLGKHTRIMTEQGEKNISDLQTGDMIMTDQGAVALKQLVTGHSDKMIAVGTCEENAVWLTKEHPIATEKGLLCAGDLTVGNLLKTKNGELKEITYLAGIDYDDTVYSLELEKSALIEANGYWVGDYQTGPDAEDYNAELQTESEPIDDTLLEELERWSCWKNEQLQKKINVPTV